MLRCVEVMSASLICQICSDFNRLVLYLVFLCFPTILHFLTVTKSPNWPNFNTSVICHQVARLIAAKKRENAEAASQNTDDLAMDDDETMEQSECSAEILGNGGGTGGSTSNKPSKKVEDDNEGVDLDDLGLLGLDQAILGSIDKCGKWGGYLDKHLEIIKPTNRDRVNFILN